MGVVNIDEIVGSFHFRRIKPEDKDLFMAIRSETSDVAKFYSIYPEFLDYNWGLILKDENEMAMMVFQEPGDQFVGTCSFQGVQRETLELGYDVMKELRGKGIGSRMVGALFELAHKHFPDRDIFVRIRDDNPASCRVSEKNGAKFLRLDDPPEVATLQKLLDENPDLPSAAEARGTIERSRNSVRLYKV